jgi:hypothetical protein
MNLLNKIKLWKRNHHKKLNVETENKAIEIVNTIETYKLILGVTQFIIILFLILF